MLKKDPHPPALEAGGGGPGQGREVEGAGQRGTGRAGTGREVVPECRGREQGEQEVRGHDRESNRLCHTDARSRSSSAGSDGLVRWWSKPAWNARRRSSG